MDPHNPSPERFALKGESSPVPVTPRDEAGGIADCWSTIGVNGDGTCPELKQFCHCRNCPVYSNAAMQLLDRQLPAEYRRQWTEHFGQEKRRASPGKESAVVFRIGPEWLALPTRVFQEIAERRAIHSLPHRKEGIILGLVNIRGQLLICVSVGRLLGLERHPIRHKPQTAYERLVVAEWQGRPLAFPVSEVAGIRRYHPEELKEPPATVARAGVSFTRSVLNWHSRMVSCLDEDMLFSALNRSLA